MGSIPQGKYSMTKTGLEFRILVIVIYLIFGICDLELLMIHNSSALPKPLSVYHLLLHQFHLLSVRQELDAGDDKDVTRFDPGLDDDVIIPKCGPANGCLFDGG